MDTLGYIVNRYNLVIPKQMPITVHGLSRVGLAYLFADLGFKCGVELGVQAGKYTRTLCAANPTMEFYAIDPYLEYEGIGIPGDQANQDAGYQYALQNMPANATLIRKKSHDAAQDFPDNYFDFVYIDGNHVFTYVADDLYTWTKKVRTGGIIAGHDYRPYYPRSFIHVFHVVNAWTAAYGIKPWFITDYATEKVRSFFWVKE